MIARRVLRFAIILIAILLLGSGGIAGYVAYSVYFRPLPKTSGTNAILGLNDTASVYRDSWAIPQIFATNTHDLFFVQGYVHAQDRWWQMELGRFMAMGRLHEIFAPDDSIITADRLMLSLDWDEIARAEWQQTPPATRDILQAYSDGVNAYILERDMESLASEYGLVGLSGRLDNLLVYLGRDAPVEPWEPYHTLLIAKLFGWMNDGDLWAELDQAALNEYLDAELLSVYQPPMSGLTVWGEAATHGTGTPMVSASTYDIADLRARLLDGLTPELIAMLGLEPSVGGNLWVVSGEHTESGKPLLGNDYHMPIEIPSTWYEMGLYCVDLACPYTLTGFSLPGIPGIVVGHNEQIAWGINPLRADILDWVVLHLNPNDPTQYVVDGTWVSFQQESINFFPDDEEAPIYTINRSRYGPVLTDLAGDTALALQWEQVGEPVTALLNLNRATNWDEFRDAVQGWQWTPFAFAYADTSNNIGYQVAGQLPIRTAGQSRHVPVDSLNDDPQWLGTIPFELLPSLYNPPSGMIVDANNLIAATYSDSTQQLLGNLYPEQVGGVWVALSRQWALDTRATRLVNLLHAVDLHTVDSFTQIQGDNFNVFAQRLMPYLFDLPIEDQDALAWFKEWDLQNHMDNPQAALFAVFWSELAHLTFDDQLLMPNTGGEREMATVLAILDQPQHPWWDDATTPFTYETRDNLLQTAFVNAYEWMMENMGEDRTEWRWGLLHQGTFVSRVIGYENNSLIVNSGPFALNHGPYEMSGGTGIINATAYQLTEDAQFLVRTLPAYRLIVDLDDFGNSRAMHTTGQSGHPASDHYKDMIVPWRTIEYHDVQWGANAIREQATKRLELEPIREQP
ncbi:MAG: penicillin acylase family protein [Anaerolineales bacterium]|nr:penicillin acylase family protein [Anaerolineales bacterium]